MSPVGCTVDGMGWEVREGDCVEAMRAMKPCSVDAVVCDPPYGLEFMGKAWDAFRIDDTGTARHRGDAAGDHGAREGGTYNGDGRPKAKVSYGGGSRPTTGRCVGCGKRDQRRNPHEPCGDGTWRAELIDPHAAPPTMLAFQEWSRQWALEAKRVLKPGGHLLAFGGTRTYHRLACAIEDAGFEIRDTIAWMYGSGFPKSLDVSKAIDAAAGATREVVGMGAATCEWIARGEPCPGHGDTNGRYGETIHSAATTPTTPDAERWQGWGTALKPAHEPIVVARKPLAGTVAATVLAHGTGALNVDGCRIGDEPITQHGRNGDSFGFTSAEEPGRAWSGRWPANVVLDPAAAAMLDEQTGTLTSGLLKAGSQREGLGYHGAGGNTLDSDTYGDSGGASRFFYCAKASSAERNAGLDGFEAVRASEITGRAEGSAGLVMEHPDGTTKANPYAGPSGDERRNVHPTVKPIDLMRWLVRLVTPPGGLVLDPFNGSGTTGCAAVLEGFRYLGLEREAEYAAIARARIAWWAEHPDGMELTERLQREGERKAVADAGQLDMFAA